MKSKCLAIAMVMSLAVGGGASTANAADGQISITGQIEGTTCAISGGTGPSPGGTNNFQVALSKVQVSALKEAGATAGSRPFYIYVGGGGSPCTTGAVAVHFESSSPGISPLTGNLINTAASGAGNVQVQIIDGTVNAPIDLRLGSNSTSVTLDATSGIATLPFFAQYIATDAATEGPVKADVQYSITFP